MRAKPVPADEQYRLIMECRSSGLTDYQWCLEHDIKPGTFYNWVRRLRQQECVNIPSTVSGRRPSKQEIVKIDLKHPSDILEAETISESVPDSVSVLSEIPVIELLLSGAAVRIPQGTDAGFLEQVLRILRKTLCQAILQQRMKSTSSADIPI